MPDATLHLTIDDVAYGGSGVGRHDGQVVFVPFTLPGERVEARLVRRAARYAMAAPVAVGDPSPQRVAPPCPYYGACGGCQYQHVAYPFQLTLKRKQVTDLLRRIGGLSVPAVEAVVASPHPYGYRNKITLHGPGSPAFLGGDGKTRVAILACPLALPAINDLMARERPMCLAAHEEWIIRCNAQGETRSLRVRREHASMRRRRAETPAPAPADAPITERLLGRVFEIPLASFFQVNREVCAALLEQVRARLAADPCEVLIDAHCGVGVMVLSLADLVRRGVGIETDERAIQAARRNAVAQQSRHCRFVEGAVEHRLEGVLESVAAARTCVVLDPPRAGCAPSVLQTLLRWRPRLLLYVSCEPPILARDLKILTHGGYRLTRVTPFDMFPQTARLEVVAELQV